jgi:hypothetical protein
VKFVLNDRVWWESQSAGRWKRKEGRVVQVVAPKADPVGVRNPGMSRDHESYVVSVRGRGRYWPRVSVLHSVAEAPPEPQP